MRYCQNALLFSNRIHNQGLNSSGTKAIQSKAYKALASSLRILSFRISIYQIQTDQHGKFINSPKRFHFMCQANEQSLTSKRENALSSFFHSVPLNSMTLCAFFSVEPVLFSIAERRTQTQSKKRKTKKKSQLYYSNGQTEAVFTNKNKSLGKTG